MNPRYAWPTITVLLSVALCSCRSTSTNVTNPSSTRCVMSLSGTTVPMSAGGGTGNVGISVDRECSWTATSQAEWIAITSAASGQGPATLSFTVAANPAAAARRGGITIGQQRVDVQQDAAACDYAIDPTGGDVPASGGELRVTVTALAGCAWTARSSAPWVQVVRGETGDGTGAVTLAVAANTAGDRRASVTVAGRTFTVAQAAVPQAPCEVALAAEPRAFAISGGTGVISVTTASSCEWRLASSAAWLQVVGNPAGTGPGSVPFRVEANAGAARTATLAAQGTSIAITQAASETSCAFTVSPRALDVAATGGTGQFSVAGDPACAWSAASESPWIALTAGSSGRGTGMVAISVGENTGAARNGTLVIAGQRVTVSQAARACALTVTPTTVSVAAGGGQVSLSVDGAASCGWTATSQASWITVSSGATGSGKGTVVLSVAGQSGASREGVVTVAGQQVAVRQEGLSCTYGVTPSTAQVNSAGGTTAFEVATGPQCAWTARSNVAWLSIDAGATGSGPGRVTVTAAANGGTQPRTGSLAIAGQSVQVTQAGVACTYSIAPLVQGVPSAGASRSIKVNAQAGCAWTAASGVPWITLTSGTVGNGEGEVAFTVAVNTTGAPRTGTITVAGQAATINQQ